MVACIFVEAGATKGHFTPDSVSDRPSDKNTTSNDHFLDFLEAVADAIGPKHWREGEVKG